MIFKSKKYKLNPQAQISKFSNFYIKLLNINQGSEKINQNMKWQNQKLTH